jgi:hypothetical protein
MWKDHGQENHTHTKQSRREKLNFSTNFMKKLAYVSHASFRQTTVLPFLSVLLESEEALF